MEAFLNDPVAYISQFHFVGGKTWGTNGKYVVIWSFSYLVVYFLLKKFMQNRAPFKNPLLTAFIFVHNFVLSTGSLALLIGTLVEIYRDIAHRGATLEVFYCDVRGVGRLNTLHPGPANFYFWIFYLSKFYELLDTVVLLLKKKEVIFLHVYHHFITIWITWASLNDHVAVTWVCIDLLINLCNNNNFALFCLEYLYLY